MNKLSSKIFIDGGVPAETVQANEMFSKHFGYPLDGQTTNPSLIAKNLKAKLDATPGEKLTEQKALDQYKKIVTEISTLLPHGSVSIQVFANKDTKADDIISQARERITWIPNASVKIPCTSEGLKAAAVVSQEMPLNITLVFSQSQAAAVYEATKGSPHPIFLSPFVGRLDDAGEIGMDIIKNILKLYETSDHHVEVLTASIRSTDHILAALAMKSNILTIPFKAFKPWADQGFPQPDAQFTYQSTLKPIPYDETITLGKSWDSYNLSHPLTDKGLELFWNDWTSLFN